MKRLPPTLVMSGSTGQVFVVTKYRKLKDNRMHAFEKFDVSAEFSVLCARLISGMKISDEAKETAFQALGLERKVVKVPEEVQDAMRKAGIQEPPTEITVPPGGPA